jgi:hypothetical protein
MNHALEKIGYIVPVTDFVTDFSNTYCGAGRLPTPQA